MKYIDIKIHTPRTEDHPDFINWNGVKYIKKTVSENQILSHQQQIEDIIRGVITEIDKEIDDQIILLQKIENDAYKLKIIDYLRNLYIQKPAIQQLLDEIKEL